MWLPASSEQPSGAAARAGGERAGGACARPSATGCAPAASALALILGCLTGCSSTPSRVEPAAQPPAVTRAEGANAAPPGGSSGGGAAAPAAGGAASGAAGTGAPPAGPQAAASSDSLIAPAPRPEVPAAARTDFDRAVSFMRAGNATEAELQFKAIALQYPQFAAPLVNLAILERKSGQLAAAEDTLKSAVAREGGSAVAWTELGATQRMRGEFTAAAASYEQAIAADAHYAPAWRNLGVLEDLYLGDPDRALKAFEQYKQLSGEEKPVNGWIAELRQRLGIAPAKRPAEAAPQPDTAPGGGASPQGTPEPGTPSEGTPPRSSESQAPASAAAAGAPPRDGG
jgi:Flp pilus assembly protein TadD